QEEGDTLLDYWRRGARVVAMRNARPGEKVATLEGLRMPAHLTPFPQVRLVPLANLQELGVADLDEALRRDLIDVAIRATPSGPLRPDTGQPLAVGVEVRYREDSALGREAARTIDAMTAEANSLFLAIRLQVQRIPQRIDPVQVRVVAVPDPEPR